jgi:hypothetical protein
VSRVPTFFYGSYMNRAVLREVDIVPEAFEAARLAGHDIVIAPRANLVPAPDRCAYGVVAELTHAELERLYAHSREVLGQAYLPHPVLVETMQGRWLPVLCYLAAAMEPRPADPAYVDRIVAPAREHGFPESYLARLESFRR